MHIGKMGIFFLTNHILKLFLSYPHPTLPHLYALSGDGNTRQHSFSHFPLTS